MSSVNAAGDRGHKFANSVNVEHGVPALAKSSGTSGLPKSKNEKPRKHAKSSKEAAAKKRDGCHEEKRKPRLVVQLAKVAYRARTHDDLLLWCSPADMSFIGSVLMRTIEMESRRSKKSINVHCV